MRMGLNRRVKIRLFPAYTYPAMRVIFAWIAVFLCVSLILWSAAVFNLRIRPLVSSMAESRATRMANTAINTAVNQELADTGVKYEDLIDIKTGPDGQVIAIASNMVKINQLKSLLAVAVQDSISDMESQEIRVPLGNIINSDMFSGWGPRVKIKLVPASFTQVDFKSSFESAGINQTKHEIILEVKIDVSMLLPTGSTSTTVTSVIPVAQTVIVGPIPDSFTGITGATGSPADNALNLVGN